MFVIAMFHAISVILESCTSVGIIKYYRYDLVINQIMTKKIFIGNFKMSKSKLFDEIRFRGDCEIGTAKSSPDKRVIINLIRNFYN